jgi:hypothetical protein
LYFVLRTGRRSHVNFLPSQKITFNPGSFRRFANLLLFRLSTPDESSSKYFSAKKSFRHTSRRRAPVLRLGPHTQAHPGTQAKLWGPGGGHKYFSGEKFRDPDSAPSRLRLSTPAESATKHFLPQHK